jgi:hypothetical protein
VSGVLPQDAGKVGAVFATAAVAMSPVGSYPIAATLTGSAAGNYTVGSAAAGSLSIAQAATVVSLSGSTSNPGVGLPISLNVQAASTTSGVPTGSITLMDGSAVVAIVSLSAGGGATHTTSSLALGSHSLTALYGGDRNFLPSISTMLTVVVGSGPDFTLVPSGLSSQSVPSGSAATFNFAVAMQGGGLASPIVLAVQGAPAGATASLNPSALPPGGAVTSFVLTSQTPRAGLDGPPRRPGDSSNTGLRGLLAILLLPALGLGAHPRARPGTRHPARVRLAARLALKAASCILLALWLTGCGDRVNTGPELSHASTYTITVTGTATSPAGTAIQHSANVTLEVL